MSTMLMFPQDDNALLKLDQAHKGLDKVNESYTADLDRAIAEVDAKHAPFIYAAQSVLYEAMGNAAMAGFSRDQMVAVMDCAGH